MPNNMPPSPAITEVEARDWINQWGRVTQLLDIPWEASGGKVLEEIRRLQRAKQAAHTLAATAALQCGMNSALLFERLADIERATK